MPPKKMDLFLKLPILNGIVKKKVLGALGLDQCIFAAGGAAPMPPDLLRWYAKLGLPIVEVYGMTENCGVSHATLPGTQRPGTVGLPYRGIQSRIDPGNGEIQVKSPGLMLGYFKEPELTRETFTADGWLHTGDKGQLDAEGSTAHHGPGEGPVQDQQGQIRGPGAHRGQAGDAQRRRGLLRHRRQSGPAAGTGHAQHRRRQASAQAAGRAEIEASLAEHLKAINAVLDPHEQLDCVVVVVEPWTVDNGFITPTFKVKRNRIEELYAVQYERWVGSRKPVLWA
jgi:long-chain acyl-CoA synthetase